MLPCPKHVQHIVGIFARGPFLPELDHHVLKTLDSVILFKPLLTVKGLTEPPAGIDSAQSLQTHQRLLTLFLHVAAVAIALCVGQDGALDALDEDPVVQGGSGRTTEGNGELDHGWVLRGPLEGLTGAHTPADDGDLVRDSEPFGQEIMLGSDIVVNGGLGHVDASLGTGGVGGGSRFTVSKDGGDDNEIMLGIQGKPTVLRGGDEPFVALDDRTREPGRVENARVRGRTISAISNVGRRKDLTGLELKVPELMVLCGVGIDVWSHCGRKGSTGERGNAGGKRCGG